MQGSSSGCLAAQSQSRMESSREALKSQFGIEVDKRKIVLDAPIKAFGSYKVDIKLYQEICGKVTVSVCEK